MSKGSNIAIGQHAMNHQYDNAVIGRGGESWLPEAQEKSPRNTVSIGYKVQMPLVDEEIVIGTNGKAAIRIYPLKDGSHIVEIGGVNIMAKLQLMEERLNELSHAPGMPGAMLAQQQFINDSAN